MTATREITWTTETGRKIEVTVTAMRGYEVNSYDATVKAMSY